MSISNFEEDGWIERHHGKYQVLLSNILLYNKCNFRKKKMLCVDEHEYSKVFLKTNVACFVLLSSVTSQPNLSY